MNLENKNLYITIDLPSGGRLGHQMKTLISCFILAEMLSCNIVYHNSWGISDRQILSIITKEDFLKFKVLPKANTKNSCKINKGKYYKGMSKNAVNDLVDEINRIYKSNNKESTLIELSGIPRIYPYQIWERKQYSVFQKAHERIRNIYYSNNKNNLIKNRFSIHVRRGDVAYPGHKAHNRAWPCEYYKNLINVINKICSTHRIVPDIRIVVEKKRWEDLKELLTIKNVKISVGDTNELKRDLNDLACSEYLFLSNSGLATLAAQLAQGSVFCPVDQHQVKHFFTKEPVPDKLYLYSNFNNLSTKLHRIMRISRNLNQGVQNEVS